MIKRPLVVVFDVNETLSDMAPLAERFMDLGAPEHLAKLWFASLLRDGFALTAAGAGDNFATLADGALRTVLTDVPLDRDVDAAVEHVMSGFTSLSLHPDVADCVRALQRARLRLVTLTNGSARTAEALLAGAGINDAFELLLSVEDAGAWKLVRAAYQYAASQCGAEASDMMLVAVHPWDIDGAARAGLRTAWVNRAGGSYPAYFTAPESTVSGLAHLAELMVG
ncbi:MAG: haloacid dehalogenase type II [Pseudonocardiales bacterium]|nr:MAG: haloacid dehalogenase type II [Pseudonocardiales bacterium]